MEHIPDTMKAVAINRFGELDALMVQTIPVPNAGPDEVLVRVASAGVGVWDPFELAGGFAEMFGTKAKFPYVLGSDGAGTVVATGQGVRRLKEAQKVYGFSDFNGNGFYAEYAAIKADKAAPIPHSLSIQEAGAMPVDAMTALRGVDDTLGLKPGESVLIFGASGGVGHLAVQLAKRMGARVFAAASCSDGVEFVRSLGADAVVDGHKDDVAAAAREFAPQGLDAALLTAGGDAAEKALAALRDGGRVAYPHGVDPEPRGRPGLTIKGYDGTPDVEAMEKLNRLIESGPFKVHIARSFPLEKAIEAEQALESHYCGKLALRPGKGA